MKIIIQEYGKLIVVGIIGLAIVGILVVGIRSWYKTTYPNMQSYDGITPDYTIDEPVIMAESIEIEQQEQFQEIDYTAYIIAYENRGCERTVAVEIEGADEVDITTKGIYQILCSATNHTGHSFIKRVPVLIY